MRRALALVAALLAAGFAPDARAAGASAPDAAAAPAEVACPGCFAVFLMPDTQFYTVDRPANATNHAVRPRGPAHLELVARYVCEHRERWREPSTGKVMPIRMVLHLGDIVAEGHLPEKAPAQFEVASRAFDVFDSCDPVVPYLVVPGNHDLQQLPNQYQRPARDYDRHFSAASGGPREAWTQHACAGPDGCQWPQRWFLGGGDPIKARSRNLFGPRGAPSRPPLTGPPAPPAQHPGRHRAAVIGTPDGGRMLFIGLDLAFDFPNSQRGFSSGKHGDDLAWVRRTIERFPGVPTVIVNHWMFADPIGWSFPAQHEGFLSDSFSSSRDLWKALVVPNPQIFLTVNGHFYAWHRQSPSGPKKMFESANTVARPVAHSTGERMVYSLFRNFQAHQAPPPFDRCCNRYGDGWNAMLVFDPAAREMRVRSYRIDDQPGYATRAAWRAARELDPAHDPDGATIDREHRGPLQPTAELDMDLGCEPGDAGAAVHRPDALPGRMGLRGFMGCEKRLPYPPASNSQAHAP